MEQMLSLSLLVLHGAYAAALPAPSQGHQDLEFHEDLSTGSPLTVIVGQDLKRMVAETDQILPGTHKDLERYERHDRPKPKVMSVLDQVVDEVLQDPDDAELRNAVTQLIKEVENRHTKKHKNPEIGTKGGKNPLRHAIDDQSDYKHDKVDTHDNDPEKSNSTRVMVPKSKSEVIHFAKRNGGRQGHNGVKPTRHNSSGKPHDNPGSSVTPVTSDSHGRNANELPWSLDGESNLSEDLNETIVDHQAESEDADLTDEDQQVQRPLIDISNSNEDPSFKSWGSDDYSDQLNNDDAEYDDLIDLRESKESIHYAESDDVSSYVNSDNNNDNVDQLVNYNDEDIEVRNNNNEVETLINEEIPEDDLNSNLTPVSINDLLYEEILNNIEADALKLSSNNDLNHVVSADIPITDNSHVNDSLRAETPTDNNLDEPETGTAPELRLAESEEVDHDTSATHDHHSHSNENRYSSESEEPALENVSRGCRGHNKIYSLSFRF